MCAFLHLCGVVVGLTTWLQFEELLEDYDVSRNLQGETGSWKPGVPLWTLACWFLEAVAWMQIRQQIFLFPALHPGASVLVDHSSKGETYLSQHPMAPGYIVLVWLHCLIASALYL